MRKTLTHLTHVLVLLAMLSITTATSAQNDERCFPETGYCISGSIRSYWENNGGLTVFGYPITDLHTETIEAWTGPVQWFERDRLEDHGDDGVLAGRLGARHLELRGTPWHTFPQVASAPSGCSFFPETGHSMCEPFNIYWHNNGGLERFGYPITEPYETTIGDWTGTVQYFERRRIEYHPENRGTPYEILLGLLGKEVNNEPCGTIMPELQSTFQRLDRATEMGCARQVYTDLLTSVQNLEYGVMVWVRYSDTDQKIYAIRSYGGYHTYKDTWTEDMSERPAVEPPEGLYAPIRGFGKVWTDHPDIRTQMGWAIEERERSQTATVQTFDNGVLIWMHESDIVYALGPDEWYSQILSRQP